jgi:hypothetical protein
MSKFDNEFKKLRLQLEEVVASINKGTESTKQSKHETLQEYISSDKPDPSYKMLEQKFGKELAAKLIPIVNFLAANPSAREFLHKTLNIPKITITK